MPVESVFEMHSFARANLNATQVMVYADDFTAEFLVAEKKPTSRASDG